MLETRKMKMWPQATVMSALLLIISGRAGGAETQSAATIPFPVAFVQFEQNATDGDVEVVFEVKGGDDGLTELVVVSPDGRTVVDFKAPGSSTFGMKQFRFETPEPSDVESLKAAYPEGVYEFYGKDSSGAKFDGKSTLSHRLPATATFTNPVPGAEDVPVKDLEITWKVAVGTVKKSIAAMHSRWFRRNVSSA
jgi:hypothetical protein